MSKFTPLAIKENIVMQDSSDELLIYKLDENKAFCLNETSASIWKLCNGNHNVNEISGLMSDKTGSNISEDFIWLALEQFRKDKLITNEFQNNFIATSRRELIRKVALTSVVALPIVSSLLAPTSAHAASTACSCVAPGDCITKTSCPNTNNCNPSRQCAP